MEEDKELIEHIEQLAHEEHELFDKESRGEASTRERARLKEIEGELEASYDLLRARRARRSAGLDPDVEPVIRPTEGEPVVDPSAVDASAAQEPTS